MNALLAREEWAAEDAATTSDQLIHWQEVTPPNVLIIEDDRDLQEGWSVFLRHHGYAVTSVSDGCAGLQAIDDEQPDAVLLDLGLPGMHGFKLLHEVRMRGHDVPIAVVTAQSSPQTKLRSARQGASIVLAKPINPHALVAEIERMLGR